MTRLPSSEARARAEVVVNEILAGSAGALSHAQITTITRSVALDFEAFADDAARLLRVEKDIRALVEMITENKARTV